ncbi:unnamed protein product [Colias eurytheme]|nr:unnamed protein product [Colias eurytheme]
MDDKLQTSLTQLAVILILSLISVCVNDTKLRQHVGDDFDQQDIATMITQDQKHADQAAQRWKKKTIIILLYQEVESLARQKYLLWQVVHMGECFEVRNLTEYLLYPYDDDYFLDQYYVMEDH